ncbi:MULTISPECIES: TatD family hydrolase [Metallosphaera]|uniref:TatD-related deoxyribonuclease n=3 Tax=Metallosphaera TaxID=41980 RepID=A4YHN2_METS5|nr:MULTISPECIES: TatD family hydrolase [Metallosphaera]ABP95934.1 TatD-related deoxyribonuclease [Metallosphaera sedula DSM 5348]AIM27918.1 TatD-related deoxyribonuclease [Metallosphaera sedula]AKV74753.1 hydrolase TatD [Metallosphaera sedula]AKV76989.1 hydrolase TatD [Metallosphaera sedula]AKV79241.1 hydrolase TatD [Metallosphaera sedula]
MLYDAHCHCSELDGKYNVVVAAVSMDLKTSMKTLNMKGVLRGVGIHPWNAGNGELERVKELVERADFIGEVGLDYRLSKASREVQIKYFQEFLLPDKTVNIHALDAWEDAFNLALRHGVKRAIFHWYTGPQTLLKDIEGAGYFITINPSVTFQEKHQKILDVAPLEIILTESDGGYVYRGRLLEPNMVKDALQFISKRKGVDEGELERVIERNFVKAFGTSSNILPRE